MDNNFSIIRQSLIEWYPIDKSDKTLLVNGGDSTLDELLDRRSTLTVVEEYDKLEGQDNDFDIILLYDVYGFCMGNDIMVNDMINTLMSHKKKDGVLLLAMENKLGMKYWAGCAEEQNGGFFAGIEDYMGQKGTVKPLSKKELEDVLHEVSLKEYKFYYPYPDYKYPNMIFTDESLPEEGELIRNMRNFNEDRYVMFDERRAYDSVIKAGLFPEFANSFLVKIV